MGSGKLFKNILITVLISMSSNIAFADSCIMIAPDNISKVECQNNNILGFHVLSNLLNEKKSVIVSSVSDGDTSFTIKFKHKKCDYKASVHNGKLEIKGDRYIKILPIDLPPELLPSEEAK